MINYDGRRFRSADGPADGTVAHYHQQGDLVWADIAGGAVRRGSVTGICRADEALEIAYVMVLVDGDVVAGRSVSTPDRTPDGRLQLHEEWERYGQHACRGTSVIEEVG